MEKYEIFDAKVCEVKEIKFSDGTFNPANKTGCKLEVIAYSANGMHIHDIFLPSYHGLDFDTYVRAYLPKKTSSEMGDGDFIDFEHSREYFEKELKWTPSKLEIIDKDTKMVERTIENKHATINSHPTYLE